MPMTSNLASGRDTWPATFWNGTVAFSYEGLDFSEEFFDVARKTIGNYMPRVKLTKRSTAACRA